MDRFSFIMVLHSIIVGLGVTELLSNVARQIRHRASVKTYWLHSLLVLIIFTAFLQQWWEMWFLQSVETWTFPIIFLLLGGPICLYIIAHLLYPEDMEGADLKALYFDETKFIATLGALTVFIATVFRPIAFDAPLFTQDNLSSALLLLAFLIIAFSKNVKLHSVIVPLVFIALAADILIFSLRI